MNQTADKPHIGVTIFFFLLTIILVGFAFWQQSTLDQQKEQLSKEISAQVTNNISQQVTAGVSQQITEGFVKITDNFQQKPELSDYNSLPSLKRLNILSNFETWTPNAVMDVNKTKKVIVLDKGSLAKAYLYIKASLNGKALTRWESVYVKMNDKGGHLFRPQSLPLPQGDKTELLYPLDTIPYLSSAPYSEQRTPSFADWFSLFKDNTKVTMIYLHVANDELKKIHAKFSQ